MYGSKCAVLSHPQDIQRVFTDGNFREKGPMYEGVRQIIGDGILTADSQKWKANQRLIAPAFHRQHVAQMVDTIAGVGKTYVDDLTERSENGLTVDVQEEMTRLTLSTLGAVVFGKHADMIGGLSYDDLTATFRLAGKAGSSTDIATRDQHVNIRQRLYQFSEHLIQAARLDAPDGTLLSQLTHTKDADTGKHLDDQIIRDEVLTIMFAGHETTALTLTWLFQLTQSHPDIRVRMQQEAQASMQQGMPTLSTLPITRRVIDEVLRLRPPVPLTARSVKEPVTLHNINLKPNDGVLPFIWGAHRHTDFWNSPEAFDPTRFLPENVKTRNKWSYLPFAAGSRICIGRELALTELTIHSALLMGAVDIQTADQNVSPKVNMTLRPNKPVYAQVTPLAR
jgi:cytochrome P450